MTPWIAAGFNGDVNNPKLTWFLLKYAVISMLCALIAGMLLALTYRYVSIKGIHDLAQQNSLAYVKTALLQSEEAMFGYLDSTASMTAGTFAFTGLPATVDAVIASLSHERRVVRFKLYNAQGLVVYSTKREQIGRNQADNPAFQAAMRGEVGAKFIHRDAFSVFDDVTEDDNLVQTYVPMRSSPADRVHGVLEVHVDVSNLVKLAQQGAYWILAVSAMIVPLLWTGLLLFVRHTTRAIKLQQELLRQRNATVTTLSAHMLEAEEAARKRLAIELNEGLAQTLSAIKVTLESAAAGSTKDVRNESKAVLPLLQQTIGEVRSHAAALRPSSLDDLGLQMTISALFRAVGNLRPDLAIHKLFMPADSEVPAALKIVIYRCMETALYSIARMTQATRVHVGLRVDEDAITLIIDHDGNMLPDAGARADQRMASPINLLRERVVLSRGELFVRHNESGATTLRAQWPHRRSS